MATDPVGTVVITTHNRPDLVQRAIRSALAQTIESVEVVIVDDGSDPPFAPETDDARLRVIRRDRAGGPSAARNAGLAVARGAWVTFLDDDDRLAPHMLDRSISAARESGLPAPVAAMSAVIELDEADEALRTHRPSTFLRGEDYFLEGRGGSGRVANSFVAPTEVSRAIGGFDEHLAAFQHDDFGLRLNAVASIAGVEEFLYQMSAHNHPRVSSRLDAITNDMERTLAKHPDAFGRHSAAHAGYMATLAGYHLKAGNWGAAVRWSFSAVARNPTRAKVWRYAAAAAAGPFGLALARKVRAFAVSVWDVLRRPTAGISWPTLMRRRVRKYLRRVLDYALALVAAPLSRTTREVARRRVAVRRSTEARPVILLSVYRSRNAALLAGLVAEATRLGWEVRLWALDRVDPALADWTSGNGAGNKLPLLNALVDPVDLGQYEWVVVVDDDLRFPKDSLGLLLAVAEHARLDLVQPAHSERSHYTFPLTTRRPLAVARWTSFVEVGPAFAVRRPWIHQVLPFPPHHEMGWGIELEWFDLAGRGARLGIVDVTAVRHVHPVGGGYRERDEAARARALLRTRGVDSLRDIQRTVATWRPWQPRPPWMTPSRVDS